MRAGIVGGLGPESTVDYYRRILAIWQERHPRSLPSVIIDSLDVNRGIELVRHDRVALIAYLGESVDRLTRAGCHFAAMAANTPHVVFNELARRSAIPLLSIVETCAVEARRRGLKRVGLLGTAFTMDSTMYPEVFARSEIEVRLPDADGRAWLHERYLGELLQGDFRDDTRAGVAGLVDAMLQRDRIDGVVLAGTELPLLIRAPTLRDLPLLDTTELHVHAIVARMEDAQGSAA